MPNPRDFRGVASRRSVLAGAAMALGWSTINQAEAVAQEKSGRDAPIAARQRIRITKLETLLVKPRWLFLKVHTDAGIVGLGEPIIEGRALTVATAVKEIEPYLLGKDPRRVVHHWQAIYRHAFYRGGPILTSALSGIDMALWDIKGKALGVPVYELLGRADPRSGPRLCARRHSGADSPRPRPRFHGVQDQPGQAAAGALRRDPGRGALRRRSSSPSCGRPPATMWTSPSTSMARSARLPPSC